MSLYSASILFFRLCYGPALKHTLRYVLHFTIIPLHSDQITYKIRYRIMMMGKKWKLFSIFFFCFFMQPHIIFLRYPYSYCSALICHYHFPAFHKNSFLILQYIKCIIPIIKKIIIAQEAREKQSRKP